MTVNAETSGTIHGEHGALPFLYRSFEGTRLDEDGKPGRKVASHTFMTAFAGSFIKVRGSYPLEKGPEGKKEVQDFSMTGLVTRLLSPSEK